MKRLAVILVLGVMHAALAQESPTAEPPHQPPGRMPRRFSPGGPSSTERWLQQLRQQDPEEYERLIGMREANPGEFQGTLRRRRDRLRQLAMGDLPDLPGFREFLDQLSSEERARLLGWLSRDRRGPFSDPRHPSESSPEARRIEQELQDLLKDPDTVSEGDPETLQAEVRARVARLHDLREEVRRRQVERMSQQLERLRHTLASRAAQREEIIDRRVQELLMPKKPAR